MQDYLCFYRGYLPLKLTTMKRVYKLFKYTYYTYCQGTRDRGEDYALLYVFEDASFNNNRSVLMNERHKEGVYEIDIKSVVDLTIKF